jgi:hypothetical protein
LLLLGLRGLGWREFSPPGGAFRVLLPGVPLEQPEEEDTPQGPARGKRFLAHSGGSGSRFQGYSVAYVDYPEEYVKAHSPAEVFRSQRDALVPSEGRLVREGARTLSGFPGKELHVETGDGGTILCRMYLVKGRLFLVVAKYRKDNRPPEVDAFFDSFALSEG